MMITVIKNSSKIKTTDYTTTSSETTFFPMTEPITNYTTGYDATINNSYNKKKKIIFAAYNIPTKTSTNFSEKVVKTQQNIKQT